MSRLLPAVVIALGLFASASSAEEEFVDAVKVDDIVYVHMPTSGSWWHLSVLAKGSVTEEQKQNGAYNRVVKVTNKAILVRTLSGRSERWILWHAVSDISRTVEVDTKSETK